MSAVIPPLISIESNWDIKAYYNDKPPILELKSGFITFLSNMSASHSVKIIFGYTLKCVVGYIFLLLVFLVSTFVFSIAYV